MDIRYDGPSDSVEVFPYGTHQKGEVRQYPDEFGETLLETSKKQKFSRMAEKKPAAKAAPKNQKE